MTDRLTAYLAGPMRSIPQFNFPSFLDAARRLCEAGYEVISPAEHDLEQGFFPFDLTGDEDLSDLGFDLKEALRWDLEQVTKADAICVLPGWEGSSGARAEVAVAAALGLMGGTLHDFLRATEVEGYEIGLASDLLAGCYSVQTDDIPDEEPSSEEDRDEPRIWIGDPADYAVGFQQYVNPPNTTLTLTNEVVDLDRVAAVERPAVLKRAVHVHDSGRCVKSRSGVPCTPAAEVRVTSSTGGEKGQKLAQYGLIPPSALRQVAEVYGYGATKYAPNNWRKGYDWRLSFDALMRHAWDFWNGEDVDKESGLHPLAHAVFHCFSLIEYGAIHPEFDDRPGKAE